MPLVYTWLPRAGFDQKPSGQKTRAGSDERRGFSRGNKQAYSNSVAHGLYVQKHKRITGPLSACLPRRRASCDAAPLA